MTIFASKTLMIVIDTLSLDTNDPRSVVTERRETDRMLVSSSADATHYDFENSMLFALVTNNILLKSHHNLFRAVFFAQDYVSTFHKVKD